MSKKKTVLIAGGLIGGTVLLVGALGGAHAFGGRHMGWGPGHGPEFGARGGPGMMRPFGGGFRPGAMLRRADANGDGVITKQEATANRERRFKRFDLDKNGSVNTNEAINALIKRFEGRIKRKIRSFDENGDGKVSLEEFNAPVLERFASRDANGDGKLSKDELPRFMGPGRGRRGGWFGRHRGPRGQNPQMQGQEEDNNNGNTR